MLQPSPHIIPSRVSRIGVILVCLLASTTAWGEDSQSAIPQGARRPALQKLLPNIDLHIDLTYTTIDGTELLLDLYVPKQHEGKLPLVIWVHGGGWANGNKDGCPARFLLELGYAVASINYRLTDQAHFPAQIEDCKAAIRYLRAHAKTYALDADHFGVWGSSAGGHLVALLGTSGQARQFDVGEYLDQPSQVQAVCDYYGPADLLSMDEQAGRRAEIRQRSANTAEAKLVGGPIIDHPDIVAQINPITYITPEVPPFLIVHGDKDTTVPLAQSEMLFDALQAVGGTVRLHVVQGGGHGMGFGGKDIDDMVIAFFDRHLRGQADAEGDVPKVRRTSSQAMLLDPDKLPTATQNRAGRQVEVILNRVLQQADKDGDGTVTREEFPGRNEMFLKLDTNGDSVLSRDDLPAPAATE